MRIVYIFGSSVPSRAAGSVHVMKMCQAFAKSGHDVVLLVPEKLNAEPGVADPYEFYGVDPSFKIEKLPWVGIKHWGYVYGLLAALRARRLRPNLVYGRFLPACFFSTVAGLPVIYESHAPPRNAGRINGWMFSRLIHSRRLRRVVVISDSLQRYLGPMEASDKRFMVAHDGADENRAVASLQFEDRRRLQVGYVGHLYPGRGIELVLKLASSCPWADFHLVGGAEPEVGHWRQRIGGLTNIRLQGFVPPSRTDGYRQSFDVLIAPYQGKVTIQGWGDTSAWMSPLKVFEYMAAGKPILCSDYPVLREVLEDGRTALLCDPEDLESWATQLRRLRDDAGLRTRLGEAAKEELRTKYTWTARARRVIEGIDGLTAARRSGVERSSIR